MTATTLQDVSSVIEKLVTEKTLSLDAMNGIQQLKERASAADKEIERLRQELSKTLLTVATLEADKREAEKQLETMSAREQAVAKREAEIHKLEMRAAVADAQAAAFRHSLGVVFAPNVVRESIMKYGSAAGNGMSVPTHENGTVQHTEGYVNPDNASGAQAPTAGDRTHLG